MEKESPPTLAADKFPITRQHRGHSITLRDDWQFNVDGPEFDSSKYVTHFKSLDAAYEEINKRCDETQKLRTKNIKLDVIVADEKGERVRISRINRMSGDIADVSGRNVYPALGWVIESLKRRVQLRKDLSEIENTLSILQILVSRNYGRIDAESYGRKVLELENKIAETTKLAQEMSQPKATDQKEPAQQTA